MIDQEIAEIAQIKALRIRAEQSEALARELATVLEGFSKIDLPVRKAELNPGLWVARTLYGNTQVTAFQVIKARELLAAHPELLA